MAGERIGFVAVHPGYVEKAQLMDGLTFCNRTLGFVNAPALMQLLVARLQGVTIDVKEYQDKRDYLYGELTRIGYSVVKPEGAFYMFPESPTEDDAAFVAELQRHRVLAVPGRGFGVPGHFRISYCVTDETLQGAIPGFREASIDSLEGDASLGRGPLPRMLRLAQHDPQSQRPPPLSSRDIPTGETVRLNMEFSAYVATVELPRTAKGLDEGIRKAAKAVLSYAEEKQIVRRIEEITRSEPPLKGGG